MPTYEYKCTKCGHRLEEMQKITASPLTLCPECKLETLQRIPSAGSGLSFKGSGFYITDYPKSESSDKGSCGCGKQACTK